MEVLWHLWVHVITVVVLHQHQTASSLVNNNPTQYHWCRPLLQIMQELSPQLNYGLHWNQSLDCCRWDGVSCDASRRQVVGLDLSSCGLTSIPSNTTLFTLTHLQNLSLADNMFDYSQIPSEMGRLYGLTHLDLSNCGFGGKIPLELYHLSNLESLDLSGCFNLTGDIQMLLGNMSKIREVFLSGVSLNTSQLPANMSSSLTHFDLERTGVGGTLPASIFEKPKLKMLNLKYNDGLTGSLPSLNSSSVSSMEVLDLSFTSISGRLPESIGFMINLRYLSLKECKFWGLIPDSIGNMTQLRGIYLRENNFTGQLPSTISNLRDLMNFDMSVNNLSGMLPSSLTNISSQLQVFDVSWNALTGPFPSRAGQGLEELIVMDFSHNYIQGTMPSWLLTLPSLNHLDLSFNSLTGHIGMVTLPSLFTLDLSFNRLTGQIGKFNCQYLVHLDLSYNQLESLSDRLIDLSSLQYLVLSNNKIHGPTPSWFNSISLPQLTTLNLSTNHLTYVEHLPLELVYLNLESNSLGGTFPLSVCNMSRLSTLILANNKLSGQIPECIGTFSFSLYVLDFRRNQFIGKIPETIGRAAVLDALQLNGNRLEGPLPQSLANCTSLSVLDLGNNMINDTFPLWLQALPMLKILIFKSNRFHGSIGSTFSNHSFRELQIIDLSHNNFSGFLSNRLFSRLQAMKSLDKVDRSNPYMGYLFSYYMYSVTLSVKGIDVELNKVVNIFTTIDLSSNNFQGSIPESIAYLYSLRLLNLSHNNISGHIPPAFGNLKELEQLDLSSNQLTEGIPQTLRNLTFLADLDVSHNHLAGPIPQGNQFSTFTNGSYAANSGLCGAPLTRSCEAPPSPAEMEQEEDDSGIMMGFTWQSVVIGYGCGIVFGFIMGSVMIALRKPICLARFVYAEAGNCLRRRRNRARK